MLLKQPAQTCGNPSLTDQRSTFPMPGIATIYTIVSPTLNQAVDKVRKREVKEFKELLHTKYIWLKDKSKYTPNDQQQFNMLENAGYQVSQAWKVKEFFRELIRLRYHGDLEVFRMLGDWMADALQCNIEETNRAVFMFKRQLKGIGRAMVTGVNNGKAERTNGSIQEIKTIDTGMVLPSAIG